MSVNRMILNETAYFGAGAREKIGEEAKNRGFKKAFIVCDKSITEHKITEKITNELKKFEISYTEFEDVQPNPTIENVHNGIERCKGSTADFIIAIGGGSVIDTAKAIGIVMTNPEYYDIQSLEGVTNTKNKSMPIIAVPTTAGTAAEVTINYVITDEARQKKMVCIDPKDIPIIAIIDAELMYSMPKSLTAATGMDALTHAIEGYITKGAWAMSDMFEIESIRLIGKHLKCAVEKPDNKEAREGMALAQYIAGMGFSNVGLGIVHSMAHQLGAVYNTPHGIANAVLLPYVMEYNMETAKEKYVCIAEALGEISPEPQDAIRAVKKLSVSIGIPECLKELNVKKEDLQMLAEKAYDDVCRGGNPKDASVEDIQKIFEKAY